MLTFLFTIVYVIISAILSYNKVKLWVWTSVISILLIAYSFFVTSHLALVLLWISFIATALVLNVTFIRRLLVTRYLFSVYKKIMPNMSETERSALNAGTITWEADVFSGAPDWDKLHAIPKAELTDDEQAFIDGPVNELCAMIDDWDITHNRLDLPEEIWQFIKDNGFFSFIIPRLYGGLEFSPYAISRILIKIYTCSVSVASTVGVPNSLGPAELLLKYGTKSQQDYYLPRLAKGEDVPCFALTGDEAGSDAAAIADIGVVCMGEYNGKETLGINLNFSKRYITLAPVASLIGLAFKLRDPDHLIGSKDDYGITCALLPRDIEGLEIGRRHYPINQAFMNGPLKGKDVFIPLDGIIGGKDMAGHGWRMLMECLAAGRAVTLPSSGVAAGLVATYATGAYARIRKQFNLPIGKFEGVEEALARIGGKTYLMDAALCLTLSNMNLNKKSAVAAAIVKYHVTELSRDVSNDSVDIHGGKAIQMGPSNYLARAYEAIPIAITVEGANILTRSMIIYGQGAIRCHPHVLNELTAAQENDIVEFDLALWKHVGFFISNFIRTFWLGITNARFLKVPIKGPEKRYYQILTRYSAALAFFSDVAMFSLGGSLKRREKISGRLGDVLSFLYMGSGVLKRFRDEGSNHDDAPLMHWASRELSYNTQEAFHNLIRNFPGKVLPAILRAIIFPLGRLHSNPTDRNGAEVANIMLQNSDARNRLTDGIYQPDDIHHHYGLLQSTLIKVIENDDVIKRVHTAYKKGMFKSDTILQSINAAEDIGIISAEEATDAREMQELTQKVISVDDFSQDELMPS
jgi:acyl-CoA dehydrogenase